MDLQILAMRSQWMLIDRLPFNRSWEGTMQHTYGVTMIGLFWTILSIAMSNNFLTRSKGTFVVSMADLVQIRLYI